MSQRKLLFSLLVVLVSLLILGGLLGAFLRLINEIKYSLAYFLPYWLVDPIFFITTILVLVLLLQNGLPLWNKLSLRIDKKLKYNNKPPRNKLQAAKKTIESIDKLLERIKDDVDREILKARRNRVQKELIRGDLVVVFIGTGSSGKTSLIRAVLKEIVGEVGAAMGTTRKSNYYRLRLKGLDRGIKLVDTPGIFESGEQGQERGKQAKSWAIRSDLMIFVIDADLRASELEVLNKLESLGKKVLLVLNKCDLRGEQEEKRLLYLLRGNCRGLIEPENIISTAASPQTIPLPGKKPWQPPAEVDNLLIRLAKVLHSDGEELLADNILLQCRNLSNTGREVLNKQRNKKSKSIIERYSWICSAVVAANPLPGIDFLGTAAVNTQMVIEIAKVYGIELTTKGAKELTLSVIKTLTGLGLIKGGVTLISTALNLHLPTVILGRVIQSIATAWLTRIAGASFITYFEQDQDWGDGGIEEVVRKHYNLNKRASSLNKFIEIAFKKIIDPIRKNSNRKLPPHRKLQEGEEVIRYPVDLEE